MFATVPMLSLRHEVDRLLDESFGAATRPTGGRDAVRPAWIPAADIRESEGEYVIELDLPGVAPSAVEVTVENGVLAISGGRDESRRDGERSHLRERAHGRFVRTFRLPKGFDEQSIVAESDHGVLRVRLPKAALPQPRRITVSARAEEPAAGGTREIASTEPAPSTGEPAAR